MHLRCSRIPPNSSVECRYRKRTLFDFRSASYIKYHARRRATRKKSQRFYYLHLLPREQGGHFFFIHRAFWINFCYQKLHLAFASPIGGKKEVPRERNISCFIRINFFSVRAWYITIDLLRAAKIFARLERRAAREPFVEKKKKKKTFHANRDDDIE